MQSEIENSAHLYGGMHDGDNRIVTPRDLEYGSLSLLWQGPGQCEYRVTTYRHPGESTDAPH
jgi:hypothetical protein